MMVRGSIAVAQHLEGSVHLTLCELVGGVWNVPQLCNFLSETFFVRGSARVGYEFRSAAASKVVRGRVLDFGKHMVLIDFVKHDRHWRKHEFSASGT